MTQAAEAVVGQIQIQFQNATLTANTASISISNGGAYQLAKRNPLQFNGSFTFASLNISTGVISFNNTSTGTAINGTVSVTVSATQDPTITVSNFSGSATVNWPTPNGPQYQQLSSGDAITLSGFTSEG